MRCATAASRSDDDESDDDSCGEESWRGAGRGRGAHLVVVGVRLGPHFLHLVLELHVCGLLAVHRLQNRFLPSDLPGEQLCLPRRSSEQGHQPAPQREVKGKARRRTADCSSAEKISPCPHNALHGHEDGKVG